jgi:hypothetical protein
MRSVARALRSAVHPVLAAAARTVRRKDPRLLFWSVYYPFNFGDWIGPFLFRALTGKEPVFALPNSFSRSTVYMTAGSILGLARENCIVWGSGILSRTVAFPRPASITAVRGPYTRERVLALGYACPEVYGDPALLLPKLLPSTGGPPCRPLGVVPHFRELDETRRAFEGSEGVRIVDVRLPIEEVVREIVGCERIVSSSLHGLVVAHAYRVPAGWASFGGKLRGDQVKFLDHFASLGIGDPPSPPDGLRMPPRELMAFAEAQSRPDPGMLLAPLLGSCPFLEPGALPAS